MKEKQFFIVWKLKTWLVQDAHIILLLFFCIIGYIGCSSKQIVSVKIVPQIEKYSPSMSSVPGFPFKAVLKGEGINKEDFTFHWKVDQGNFLEWEPPSGKVNKFPNDIKTKTDVLYWSNLFDNKEIITNIFIEVIDKNGTVLATDSIRLETDKETLFTTIKEMM